MKRCRSTRRFDSADDRGQTTVFVLLAVGLFLLAFVGFAVDIANLWFHRQAAQTAADAACTAGAMDMLVDVGGGGPNKGGFTPGTAFDCSASSSTTPCQYAALNGYDGKNKFPGNDVSVSFPVSVPGVTTPSPSLAPNPFLRVDVLDHVKTYFTGMLSGKQTVDVRAFAVCGLVETRAPVPIIVLNPTCQDSFLFTGSATMQILGGPTRSVQVNSSNTTCAASTSNGCATESTPLGCPSKGASINLCQGGPNYNGSSLGVYGAPANPDTGFATANSGTWQAGAPPIMDPYALTPPPTVPTTVDPAPVAVPWGTDGCPDHTGSGSSLPSNLVNLGGTLVTSTPGCVEFRPGLYTKPIVVKQYTAIFVPGIYYLRPTSFQLESGGTPGCTTESKPSGGSNYDLAVDSNGVLRVASNAATGSDGSHGVMFYLSGLGGGSGYGSVFFGSNAGNYGTRSVDSFASSSILCPGASVDPKAPPLPPTLSGNVLSGPCTTNGNYVPYDAGGSIPGLLFFQDRNNGTNGYVQGQPSMQGGGGLLLSGNMYFHNCSSLPCAPYPTNYNAFFQLQGNPGPGTYLLGNITADQLVAGGNGSIYMQLNGSAVYDVLKASLLR